jgi:hypothetical protein
MAVDVQHSGRWRHDEAELNTTINTTPSWT